jgi:hypothetical protein
MFRQRLAPSAQILRDHPLKVADLQGQGWPPTRLIRMERQAPLHPYETRMSSIEMVQIQTMTESVKNLSMSPKMGFSRGPTSPSAQATAPASTTQPNVTRRPFALCQAG